MKHFLIFIWILFYFQSFSQIKEKKEQLTVLEAEIIDSIFVFGKWTEDGGTELCLKYLGSVRTNQGNTFKILTSSWIWGLSHRATSKIVVFNEKNEFVGSYYDFNVDELPNKLENSFLIFDNKDNQSCDKNLVTKVSLLGGLPIEFFVNCKGSYGNLFYFH